MAGLLSDALFCIICPFYIFKWFCKKWSLSWAGELNWNIWLFWFFGGIGVIFPSLSNESGGWDGLLGNYFSRLFSCISTLPSSEWMKFSPTTILEKLLTIYGVVYCRGRLFMGGPEISCRLLFCFIHCSNSSRRLSGSLFDNLICCTGDRSCNGTFLLLAWP